MGSFNVPDLIDIQNRARAQYGVLPQPQPSLMDQLGQMSVIKERRDRTELAKNQFEFQKTQAGTDDAQQNRQLDQTDQQLSLRANELVFRREELKKDAEMKFQFNQDASIRTVLDEMRKMSPEDQQAMRDSIITAGGGEVSFSQAIRNRLQFPAYSSLGELEINSAIFPNKSEEAIMTATGRAEVNAADAKVNPNDPYSETVAQAKGRQRTEMGIGTTTKSAAEIEAEKVNVWDAENGGFHLVSPEQARGVDTYTKQEVEQRSNNLVQYNSLMTVATSPLYQGDDDTWGDGLASPTGRPQMDVDAFAKGEIAPPFNATGGTARDGLRMYIYSGSRQETKLKMKQAEFMIDMQSNGGFDRLKKYRDAQIFVDGENKPTNHTTDDTRQVNLFDALGHNTKNKTVYTKIVDSFITFADSTIPAKEKQQLREDLIKYTKMIDPITADSSIIQLMATGTLRAGEPERPVVPETKNWIQRTYDAVIAGRGGK